MLVCTPGTVAHCHVSPSAIKAEEPPWFATDETRMTPCPAIKASVSVRVHRSVHWYRAKIPEEDPAGWAVPEIRVPVRVQDSRRWFGPKPGKDRSSRRSAPDSGRSMMAGAVGAASSRLGGKLAPPPSPPVGPLWPPLTVVGCPRCHFPSSVG